MSVAERAEVLYVYDQAILQTDNCQGMEPACWILKTILRDELIEGSLSSSQQAFTGYFTVACSSVLSMVET